MNRFMLIGGVAAALVAGAAFAHGGKGYHDRHGGGYGGYHHGYHDSYGHKGRKGRRGERLERRFGELDANDDGLVTAEEMTAAKEARFKAMGANGDGVVDARELVDYRMLRRAQRRIERNDADKDGKLQLGELPERRSFTRFDLNNDGSVSRAELDLVKRYGRKGGRWGNRRGDRDAAPEDAPRPEAPAE